MRFTDKLTVIDIYCTGMYATEICSLGICNMHIMYQIEFFKHTVFLLIQPKFKYKLDFNIMLQQNNVHAIQYYAYRKERT